ncbi:MAG: hypothetical protein ACLFNP_05890 [Spirochaetaceae bacterium]
MYRLRAYIILPSLLLFLSLILSCASTQNGGARRRISELEAFGGDVAYAAELVQEGGGTEGERLELLARLAVALAERGEENAALEAVTIGSERLSTLSETPADASRVSAGLAEGYARLERTDAAAERLESGRLYALRAPEVEERAELLAGLVLTAARGEGVYAEATRAVLDEIYVLDDPDLRSATILHVADTLSREEVAVDLSNLLQQSIPAAAEIANPYVRGARYARISGLFRALGDIPSARSLAEKGVQVVDSATEPVEQVDELEALGELAGHLRERGLLGEAQNVIRRIPVESERAWEMARLAREAQARGETGRGREIAEEAVELINRVRGRPAEVLAAQGLLARFYRDLGSTERSDPLVRRVASTLADAPATPSYQEPFIQLLLYRIEAGEVGTLREIVRISDSADFRARLLIELAQREELVNDERLQAGIQRQAAGEDPRELSRQTQLDLVAGLLSNELLNEALRLLEETGDPYVRAAGYIEILRRFPDYSGPI